MDNPLLKYSAKDYFFKAALCHFIVDELNAKVRLLLSDDFTLEDRRTQVQMPSTPEAARYPGSMCNSGTEEHRRDQGSRSSLVASLAQ